MKYSNKILFLLLVLVFILPFFASADVGFTSVKTIGDTTNASTYNYQDTDDVFIDSSGYKYYTGGFAGTVDFDPSAGTDIHTYTRGAETNGWDSYSDVYIAKFDAQDNFVWAKTFGGNTNDWGTDVTVDSSGNVYIAAMFQLTADFDPGVGVYNITANDGGNPAGTPWKWNVATVKLDSSGNFVWAKAWGASSTNEIQYLNVAQNGSLYIVTSLGSTADVDPGAGVVSLGAGQIISKFDLDGNLIWAKRFYNNASASLYQKAVMDSNDNIYITGIFSGTADFDPGAGTNNMTAGSLGGRDLFVLKLDSDGIFAWAKQMPSSSMTGDWTGWVAPPQLDTSGNIMIFGRFEGTVDFDPGVGTANATSNGGKDLFLLKLDSSGNYTYVKTFGGTSDENINGMELDSLNNIYLYGMFQSTVDFDPGAGTTNLTSTGGENLFLLKLDSSANFEYVKQFPTGAIATWNGRSTIRVIAPDTLYLIGHFSSTIDFDFTAGVNNQTSMAGDDIFILRLDPADTTPATITLTTQTDKNASTSYNSNTITVSGINTGATISISGCFNATNCEYSLNSAAFTSTSGTVVNGDTIILRMTSSAISGATSTLSLTIGTSTVSFVVTNAEFSAVPTFILQAQSDAERLQQNNTVVLPPTNTNNNQNTQNNNTTSKFQFLKNLKYKDNNTDVKELQKYLNTHNFPVSTTGIGSLNNETNYFGIATKNALIKYQIANDIKPAVGYFGILTRNKINNSN